MSWITDALAEPISSTPAKPIRKTREPQPSSDEAAFQRWYAGVSQRYGLDPNPDDPRHHYDYRAAFRAGVAPVKDSEDGQWHWPSTFKTGDHPQRYVFENGQWLDTKDDAPPSSDWLSKSYSEPVNVPKPKELGFLETAGENLSLLKDAAGEMVADRWEQEKEVAKALGRGFTSSAENLLVNAPSAAFHGAESALGKAGLLSDGAKEAFDKGQRNIEVGWNAPLQGWIDTAQRFYAPAPEEQQGFVAQLKANPIRTITIGLAENAPQMLITLGATAVNPALGLAVAGSSEGGAAWKEAKLAGATDDQAATAAGLTALPNMILEYFPAGKLLSKAFRGVPKQQVASVLREIFKQALREGSTEVLQEANSVVVGLAVYAGDKGMTWNDFQSAFSSQNLERYGAAGMMGAIMGGGSDFVVSAGSHEAHTPAQAPPAGGPAPGSGADGPAPATGPEDTPRSEQQEPAGGRVVPFPAPAQAEDAATSAGSPEGPTAPVFKFPQPPIQEQSEVVDEQAGAADGEEAPGDFTPRQEETASEGSATPAEGGDLEAESAPAPSIDPEAPAAPVALGREATTYTERGQPVVFDYGVIEADHVRTSHSDALNPESSYPTELQPRDRDRAASAAQVSRIEQNLNPELVGESPKASDGAPIIGSDGLVEGGNARTIGIRRAYRSGSPKAEEYRQWLRSNAEKFGLSTETIDSMSQPVLVRVRRTEVPDRAEFARELNESGVAAMSATEQAKTDAARITPEMLSTLRVPESGDVNWLSNREFVDGFFARLTTGEYGALYDKKGQLSVEGQQRLRNAVLARAFDDADAIAKLIESSDNNVRNIGAAMMREAPRVALSRAAMEKGALYDRDLAPDISAALQKLSALRADGAKVSDYLAQGEMFGAELSPESRELLTIFDRHARSGRAIGEILRTYSELVEQLGNPQQSGLFGPVEAPSKLDLLRAAVTESEFHRQRDLFGAGDAGSGAAGSAYLDTQSHTGQRRPEATKVYRRILLKVHPDRATTEEDRTRRTAFVKELNNAYEIEDMQRLKQIEDAWDAGKDIDVRSQGRRGPNPTPRNPKSPPPPKRDPRRPAPPPPRQSAGSPPPPPPENAARRGVDTETRKLAMELPEIVEVVEAVSKGRLPKVKQVLRSAGGNALGLFRAIEGRPESADIELRADIAENAELASRVLAHELGHWVEFIDEATMKRGNILGSLASLKKYLRHMIDELPTNPSRVFTEKERQAWRRQALRDATDELGKGHSGIPSRQRELYAERVKNEMQSRRLVDKETILEELRRVSSVWRGAFAKSDRYRNSRPELYADGFSALMNDPGLVKDEAPTFHSLFFNYLGRKPRLKQIYDEIQARVGSGHDGVLDHRLTRYLDMIREGAKGRAEQLTKRPSLMPLVESLVDGLIDRKSLLYRDVKKARLQGKQLDPQRNPVFWVEEAAYHSSEAAWYMDRMHTDVLSVTRGAGVSDAEFGAVLGLTRAGGERAKLFNPLGIQGRFAEELREHLVKKLGKGRADAVRKAAKAWWAIRQEVLDQVEQSRALSAKQIGHAKGNAEYVKFFVASHLKDEQRAKASGRIYEQIGTLSKIGNPVVETALTDLALLRLAHRTQTARSIVDFYKSFAHDAMVEAERGRDGRVVETRERGKGTVFFLENGELRAFYASERIVSFMESDPDIAGATYRAYNIVSRPLRALFVDKNPFWAVWNIYKDSKAFAKQVVSSASPRDSKGVMAAKALASPVTASFQTFRYVLKAIPDAGRDVLFGEKSPVVREMLKGRMLVETGSVSTSLAGDESEAMNVLLQKFGILDARHHGLGVRVLEGLWNWAGKPGELTERLVKIGGYKYLKENQERLGLTDKEVAHRVRTLVGTPDVMRRGTQFKLTNSIWLFSNVGKEGLRSAAEAAKLNPSEYAMKTLAFDLMPKMVMIAVAAGWAGEELKEWFAKLSEYDKANYMIIPWGTTPSGKAVFTRLPHDHIGQMLGSLLWKSFSDERGAAELFSWMDQNFPWSPSSIHPVLSGAWATKDYLEGKNPMDSYTGRPMVPEKVFQAGGMRSHVAFGKALWNELGLNVLIRFNTEDSAEITTWLEDALDLPLLGPALARFVKVSDYGTTEQLREITEEEKREQARRSLEIEDVIREGLAADPDASARYLYRVAKDAGIEVGKYSYFEQRVDRIRARTSGDPYEKAKSYARSKETRERIEAERDE